MKSRVQPKYKTKYHVGNCPAYDRALVQRGNVTLWLSADARDAWRPSPSGQPGGQQRFSDLAIKHHVDTPTCLPSALAPSGGLCAVGPSPRWTSISRRPTTPRFLAGVGTWPSGCTASRSRGRFISSSIARASRSPAKVSGPRPSTAVAASAAGRSSISASTGRGVIVAHTLTEATVDDATTGVGLIEALHADLARVTADAGLRHDRVLRGGHGPGRNRRGPSEQGGTGVRDGDHGRALGIARSGR